MALPFGVSIAVLSLVQGAVVAMPRDVRDGRLDAFRGRRWAVVPPLSVVAFVLVARAAEHASAESLTYLALVAVPALAALALAWLARGARPALALVTLALFALAWVDRRGLAGEGAAVILTGLSCVSLGVVIAAVTPERWLAAGIVAMAVADTALVVSDQLQRPNNVLNAAHPVAGLPRLQSAAFGSAVMGYGDLFVAGAFGGLLAVHLARREQLRGAALVAALALAFDLLFLVVDELPATVPVAIALLVLAAARTRSGAADRDRTRDRERDRAARRDRGPAAAEGRDRGPAGTPVPVRVPVRRRS